MVPPRQRVGADQNLSIDSRGGNNEEEVDGVAEGFSPIAGRTTGRQGDAGTSLQAPLQQAVGNDGPVAVKVPFSVIDLRAWKETAGIYKEDPEKVAKVVETIIQTWDPD